MTGLVRGAGRIRVVYLTPALHPGGAERQMLILASALPRERFEVRFLVMSDRGSLADEAEAIGARVDALGLPADGFSPFRPRCLIAAIRALRRYRELTSDVDIVDAWLAPAMTFAAMARPVARVPTVLGGRRWLGALYRPKPWYRRAAASLAARRLDMIVTNSCAAAQELITEDRVPSNRIRVIPNAVRPAISSPDDRQRFRNRWGFADGDVVVGCVANYKPEKGLSLLIEAAARLRGLAPRLRFVVVGEGAMRAVLEEDIRARGMTSMFVLHGQEPDARPIYSAFDIFVQASESEGLPNVILEAAVVGLPIVATAVGGTTEVVTNEREALLVDSGDVEGLAAAILRMVSDPELRERMGAAAQERAATFSTERLVRATAMLYEELADRSWRDSPHRDGLQSPSG